MATANTIEGLRILVERTRSALPEAKIGVVVSGFGWPDLWAKHLPFVRHVLDTYDGREGDNLFVLPAYLVVDTTTIPDSVHPDAVGRDQWAELVFAFIMGEL